MKVKIRPLFLFLFFIIVFFIFYKSLKNSNIYSPNTFLEKNIPYFVVTIFDTNEKTVSEKIFKDNKFYLMNIWASWCIPCREDHLNLMILSKQKKLEIIGLNYKDKNENAKKFLNELGNPYALVISDPDGTVAIEWGAYGVPETFLIYNKKIIKKVIGPINESSLQEIKNLIK